MIKKIISAALTAVMLAASLVLPSSAVGTYTNTENERKIYEFAINKLGASEAVASAILANIYCESGFNPTATAMESDGYISYGICQWHKGRYDALKSYCTENGLDYTTLDGQLSYLKYELENGERAAYSKVRDVPNTAEGAYTASYNWAKYFERCAKVYYERRASLARDSFWPLYGGETPSDMELRGITYPSTLEAGGYFSIYGSVVSPRPLALVSVQVLDSAHNVCTGKTVEAAELGGENYYDLHNADRDLLFNKLGAGSYTYAVYACDNRGYAISFTGSISVGDTTTSYTGSKKGSYHDHDNKVGYGWNSGEIIIQPSVEEEGLILYTCYCGEQKTVELPRLTGDYTVTFDPGDGIGAPLPQGKEKGKVMIISPVKPTREGYDFLGWALSPDASKPEYLAGGEFYIDSDTTLYAVWSKKQIPLTGISVDKEYISLLPGETATYRASPLPPDASEFSITASGWDGEIISCDGGLVTAVAPGVTHIRLSSGQAEKYITVCVASPDRVAGDINGDGTADTRDIVRLMKYISGSDEIVVFADINDDGFVDTRDIIRLMKYIAGSEVEVK